MNPEAPRTPREEMEIRRTALLMGELSPEDAAAWKALIAADPELAALHVRLRHAMALLREAKAMPEYPASQAPARLSAERRAKLLAHFQGSAPAPGPLIVPPKRDWKWTVPLGLAASLMALLGGTLWKNGFGLRRERSAAAGPFTFSVSNGERVGEDATAVPPGSGRTWASQPGTFTDLNEPQFLSTREKGTEIHDYIRTVKVPGWGSSFQGRYSAADGRSLQEQQQGIVALGSGGVGGLGLGKDAETRTGSMDQLVIDKARLALTAHSRSPELNLFGRPRVTVWPAPTDSPSDTTHGGAVAASAASAQGPQQGLPVLL